jgi:hypothetical protein
MSAARPGQPGTSQPGTGTHAEQEWVDVDPVATGLAALAATVARPDEQEW